MLGLLRHRHSIASMGALALSGFIKRASQPLSIGRVFGDVPRYDPALGADFIRVTHGIDNGLVPPTFYVTWAMAALADALVKVGLPYDYSRVLHAASEVTYVRPLRVDERATYEVRVAAVDDTERRARIRVEGLVTVKGDEVFRHAMELHVPKKGGGGKREPLLIDPTWQRITSFEMPKSLGLDYARVSGDFNPIHWSATAAKVMGFKRNFIQGYCTKALIAHAFDNVRSLRVEFKKPIFLPASVSLFLGPDGALAVGDGDDVYVTGRVTRF